MYQSDVHKARLSRSKRTQRRRGLRRLKKAVRWLISVVTLLIGGLYIAYCLYIGTTRLIEQAIQWLW